MVWLHRVGHVELADAGIAGDDAKTVRGSRSSRSDVSLCYVSYIRNGIMKLRAARLVLPTVHPL